MSNELIFVYGTLRRGYRNHYLIRTSRFLGTGLLDGFVLVQRATAPGMIKGNGTVQGELFEVSRLKLFLLDILEINGILYSRQRVEVTVNAQKVECWAYIYKNA